MKAGTLADRPIFVDVSTKLGIVKKNLVETVLFFSNGNFTFKHYFLYFSFNMFIMSKWFILMDFLWYQKNYGWKTAQEHNEDVHERKTSQCQCISINMAQQQMQPTTKKTVNEFKESFFFWEGNHATSICKHELLIRIL